MDACASSRCEFERKKVDAYMTRTKEFNKKFLVIGHQSSESHSPKRPLNFKLPECYNLDLVLA